MSRRAARRKGVTTHTHWSQGFPLSRILFTGNKDVDIIIVPRLVYTLKLVIVFLR